MPTGKGKKIFWGQGRIAVAVQFVAVLFGMLAVLYEFGIQRPKDRELRDVQLHATLAELATSEDIRADAAATAVRNILEVMHAEKADMTGIVIPGLTFRMTEVADFEGADWSDAELSGTSFLCSDRLLAAIENGEKAGWCANLREARLKGSNLTRARFEHTDFSGADFAGAVLLAIKFKHSEFSGADLSHVVFACFGRSTADTPDCPELTDVRFHSAKMRGVAFWGVNINGADFTAANLSRAHFECAGPHCVRLEGVCFRGADLTGAEFRGVTISNTDFTNVLNLDKATFERVTFDSVTFDYFIYLNFGRARTKPANFDDPSWHSLKAALNRRVEFAVMDQPCTGR